MTQSKTNSNIMAVRKYQTNVEPTVKKVLTASTNEGDILRGLMMDEIYRLRNARKDLRAKYPGMFTNVSIK